MSVMIVSGESLSMMCKGLKEAWWNRNKHPHFNPMSVINPSAPTSTYTDYMPDKDMEEFVRQCALWNCKAYHLRYEESHEEVRGVKPERFSKNYQGDVTLVQIFKTMCCIRYNSNITDYLNQKEMEGEYKNMVADWQPWYEKVLRLCDNLAYAVAESTQEYNDAVWG